MEKIVIVEAFSTGINLIMDCITRGYKPVVLNPRLPADAEPSLASARIQTRKKYADMADFYDEADTYGETLSLVRSLNPKLVLAGSEAGVDLATHLAADLGLPSNPYERIGNYIHKNIQQAALARYGIRAIRGKMVQNVKDAIEYFHQEHFSDCVLKPIRGAGSVGVYMCHTQEDIIHAFQEISKKDGILGKNKDGILMQEKIDGTEFIVNTVSYEGVHRLTSIWKYSKIEVAEGRKIYNYAISLDKLEAGSNKLIQYAFAVADALGYKFGAIHGEYMIDKDGPVLIEANCRPMGAGMPASFTEQIFGHHETDTLLDSYLNSTWHFQEAEKPYRPYTKGVIKLLIAKKVMKVNSIPALGIIRRLKSCHSFTMENALFHPLVRTVDLETSPGTIYLTHKDPSVVEKDLQFLCKLENEYFDMIYSEFPITLPENVSEIEPTESLLSNLLLKGSILLLSNELKQVPGCVTATGESVTSWKHGFDWGILDLAYRENEDIESMIEDFYNLTFKIRKGGHLLIPPKTYLHFPHGSESIEVLCEAIGLLIEAPSNKMRHCIVATVSE